MTQPKSVGYLYTTRGGIDQAPAYQREGGVWSTDRQQLFLDSVLNGFDIPKLYMHDLSGKVGSKFALAIIDGKQRLTTIWSFMDGDIKLAADFELSDEVKSNPLHRGFGPPPTGGSKYDDLDPTWKQYFQDLTLDVVLVTTADPDDIEELFSRLNNGEPLNAAEKRNNIRGAMTELVKKTADHKFFKERLKITDKRYKHREIAVKFLALEMADKTTGNLFADLKKRHLDELCRNHASMSVSDASGLYKRVDRVLNQMCNVFDRKDPLVSKMATPPLYYSWLKDVTSKYGHKDLYALITGFLRDFEVRRIKNLDLPEDRQDPGLTEYSRLSQQATNDRNNLKRRADYLTREFLASNSEVEVKDSKRLFSYEERYAIWELGGRQCDGCGGDLKELDDMEADHSVQWSWGGPTTLANARCLCESCNQKIAKKIGKVVS